MDDTSRSDVGDDPLAAAGEGAQTERGNGGETHQTTTDRQRSLTTQQGSPVADDQNTLSVGERGPAAMEDFHFREKIFHFDHERIPERVVHARGYGAHGYFENYEPLTGITRADPFQQAGQRTPVFVRFSTVAGNKGSFDLARDVRGFAVKFYTGDGNWDIVGNNIPVFFIQDPIKFPDIIHSVKQEPDRGFPQAQSAHDTFWDFVSLTPESTHMIMWTMSDRAIPRSFRFMEGFGVHSFRFLDENDESTYVKFHWKPKLGLQSVTWNEAVKINGADPDFHRRDLWDAIENGDFPEWELAVQLFDDDFAERFEFDILDPTKIIPEEEVPLRPIGRLVLDRLVDNFFAETEQVAFCTQNVVPGIDFTNDPLLQGRNFSYLDTQLKRLGSPNFTHLPVNAPKCPFATFQQDGHMAMHNPGGRAIYEPNSFNDSPRENPEHGFRTHPSDEAGQLRRVRPESFADHYSQARQFYISQTPVEQQHLRDALVFELSKVKRTDIRTRVVAGLRNVDDDLAAGVASGLGLPDVPAPLRPAREPRRDLPESPALSILRNGPDSFAGRKLGVVVTEGTDAAVMQALRAAFEQEGAMVEVVGPTVGEIVLSDQSTVEAVERIDGGPSVLYDAVAVLPSQDGAELLARHPRAREFVADAWSHRKFVGHVPEARGLLEAAGIGTLDDGFVALVSDEAFVEFVERCRELRHWERESGAGLA